MGKQKASVRRRLMDARLSRTKKIGTQTGDSYAPSFMGDIPLGEAFDVTSLLKTRLLDNGNSTSSGSTQQTTGIGVGGGLGGTLFVALIFLCCRWWIRRKSSSRTKASTQRAPSHRASSLKKERTQSSIDSKRKAHHARFEENAEGMVTAPEVESLESPAASGSTAASTRRESASPATRQRPDKTLAHSASEPIRQTSVPKVAASESAPSLGGQAASTRKILESMPPAKRERPKRKRTHQRRIALETENSLSPVRTGSTSTPAQPAAAKPTLPATGDEPHEVSQVYLGDLPEDAAGLATTSDGVPASVKPEAVVVTVAPRNAESLAVHGVLPPPPERPIALPSTDKHEARGVCGVNDGPCLVS